MREIRYRAKAVVSGDYVDKEVAGKWVYGFYVESKGLCKIINHLGDFVVQKPTVGQFINLPDKNGVEIYEGDIVRVVYLKKDRKFMGVDGDYIAKVVYDEKLAMFVMISDGKIDDCFETDAKIEVIGNIYEGQTAEVL